MRTATPRWLLPVLLPALAVALFVVHDQIQVRAWGIGNASDYREVAQLGTLVGALLGPIVTAILFAYPIARIYGRRSLFAAALICIPTVVFTLLYDIAPDHDAFFISVYIVQIVSLGVFAPMSAFLASRALTLTSLVVLTHETGEPDDSLHAGDGAGTIAAVPRLLLLTLIPVLAVALYNAHHFVQSTAIEIGLLPDARNLELASLLLCSIFGPAVTASLFAYPIARLYAHRSVPAASLITAPTVIVRIYHFIGASYLPWTNAFIIVQWISLIVLVPLAAWLVSHKLGRSRLAILTNLHSVA